MLSKIIEFSIKNKFIICAATVVLILWGVWSAMRIPIDAVPDITNNQVQIITLCPTLACQEVEQLITYPIEQSVANIPGLSELRSISRFGLSVITAVFADDVDIYFARQLINEKLKEAEEKIPNGLGKPELAPVSTGLGEVYQYIIHPVKGSEDNYSAMDLRTMQDWIVARQLYGTPGIAEVNSFGGELKQYEVSINPDRLYAMNVTIPEIFSALENNNENTGGAYIDKKPNSYFIRGVGMINNFSDIKNIVVKNNPNGVPVLIKDVADVKFGNAVRYGALTYNGEKDVVGGIVMMLKGANSSKVVSDIKEKMITIQRSLPDDVVIEAYLDRTDLVNRAISTVRNNLIEGALIVIFVLVLFLGNLRAGLIVASAIPLSMLFAFGMMNLFGVSANLMSLGAIDFGLIVDGAVIIVESVFHKISTVNTNGANRILTRKEMDRTVFDSASTMMSSASFGQIIILIVYLPILSLTGIEGKMFMPMAQTVSFAILGALILSVTYIPMASSLFLSKKTIHKKNFSDKIMESLIKFYTPLLQKAISAKSFVISSAAILFLISLIAFIRMGGEFIPTLQEGDFAFHCILPQGTSLSQSIETSMKSMRIIKEFDEVKMVVGKTGSAEVPTDPMPPEATDMIILLKPESEWNRDISYDELADEIMKKLEVIPGVFFEKSQPIQMRFNELMTGIRQDVAIKIYGENMDTLLQTANKISSLISDVKGITEPSIERVEGLPQIVIAYDRAKIANYGLDIESINHIVSTAFAGGTAGVVFENERQFDLVVRLDSLYRKDLSDIGQLFIPAGNGVQIPLSQLAEIKMQIGPAQISRENGRRRIVIGFNIKDRDVSGVVKEIEQKINKIKLPEGYYYDFGGSFENLQEASKRLMIAVPLALGLIFVLLYFAFNSIRQAVLIYTAIPMSAIGGVMALLIRDMPFSISAGVGFIALFGVAVLNGIVLVSTLNQLEKSGVSDVIERVKKATQERLRPVLMTAAVASLGFFPMAFSTGAGAEVQKPLATVVIGGLVTATFLTLFVLPLLYILFSGKKIKTNIPVITVLIFLLLPLSIKSQTPVKEKIITVEEAVEMSLKNNLSIQAKTLDIQSAVSLKKSVFDLPKTEINFQYGQFNSINNDNAFSVEQTIPFPTLYSAQSDLYKEEIKSSELIKGLVSNDVKSKARYYGFKILYFQNVQSVLQSLDSLYSEFVRIAELKYLNGETNLLEKTTAEAKQGEFKLLISANETELKSVYNSLKSLMNESTDFTIAGAEEYSPLTVSASIDTSLISENPFLKHQYQQAIVAEQTASVESAQILPDLKAGYMNQSIIGYQNVNGSEIYFDGADRFTGFNVGIEVPLTFFNKNKKVESLEYRQKAILRDAENQKKLLVSELQNYFEEYKKFYSEYSYYKTAALINSETMINTARLGYSSGEVGYAEYIFALQNAGSIKLNYLESIDKLNRSVININHLINK